MDQRIRMKPDERENRCPGMRLRPPQIRIGVGLEIREQATRVSEKGRENLLAAGKEGSRRREGEGFFRVRHVASSGSNDALLR